MFLPTSYKNSKIWSTIDIEQIEDANFGITLKNELYIDYEKLIEKWMETNKDKGCAFVLGSFAKKYPGIIKKVASYGIEIASHSLTHTLVYELSFKKWTQEIEYSKKLLEDTIGKEIKGYRSPSWSLPFEKRYYDMLIEKGYSFSSSYFPFKTYMYGNEIDRKKPFEIYTKNGIITEIPIPKYIIPFSGGFYTRVLPYPIIYILTKQLMKNDFKPVLYIHPYELINAPLIYYFSNSVKKDKAYILSFIRFGNTRKKIARLLKNFQT